MTVASAAGSEDQWIPILDYAVLRGVSTSTLRRYIKAKKIQYKVENGRYLLRADAQIAKVAARAVWEGASLGNGITTSTNAMDMSIYSRVRELEEKLAQAQEQIGELKMLVAIYEEKLSS